MCGVIVVDAGRSRSTCLGRDACIHDHCLEYRHNYALFYQLPNSNLFTHRMLSSREMPLVKTMAPGSIFHHIKLKTPCCNVFTFILLLCFTLFIYHYENSSLQLTTKGLTTPCFALGASICFCVCRCC